MPVCTNQKCNPGKFDHPKLSRFGNSELAQWYCVVCRNRYDGNLKEIKFKCIHCKADKSISEFGPDRRVIRGHRSSCNRCRNKAEREMNAYNKTKKRIDKIDMIADLVEIESAIVRLIIDEYER